MFSLLNRPILFFPKEQVKVKPKEEQFIEIEAPFIDKILRISNSEDVRQEGLE